MKIDREHGLDPSPNESKPSPNENKQIFVISENRLWILDWIPFGPESKPSPNKSKDEENAINSHLTR